MNIKFCFPCATHFNIYLLEHKRETQKSILKTNRAQSNKDKINNNKNNNTKIASRV